LFHPKVSRRDRLSFSFSERVITDQVVLDEDDDVIEAESPYARASGFTERERERERERDVPCPSTVNTNEEFSSRKYLEK